MKYNYKGYTIKSTFVGDSITPVYLYKVYKPRKHWFPILVWKETLHRENISNYKATAEEVVLNYEKDLARRE